MRLAFALARRGCPTALAGGLRDWTVLKTTQSGYEGFLKDRLTTLPDVRERLLATTVAAEWRHGAATAATALSAAGAAASPDAFDVVYSSLLAAFSGEFFGPARGGDYSPGVQATLYRMATAGLAAAPGIEDVTLRCPNIHFIGTQGVVPSEHDVYVATSEPHGTIQATVGRVPGRATPRPRL